MIHYFYVKISGTHVVKSRLKFKPRKQNESELVDQTSEKSRQPLEYKLKHQM